MTIPDAGLADRVVRGQQDLHRMRTSKGLREAADRLAEYADQLGCRDVYPASTGASAIASVAVALNDTLRTVTLGEIAREHIDKVLVVEAVAVSGLKVRRAVLAVREAGAHWVSALILREYGPAADPARYGVVDDLAVAG